MGKLDGAPTVVLIFCIFTGVMGLLAVFLSQEDTGLTPESTMEGES